MFARVSTYGIVIAALLMTACSQNETELNTASQEPVAISFCVTEDATTRAEERTEPSYIEQLRYKGFGVFATVEESGFPNLMYNEKVSYTYLADDANNGYWSYSPTKYWPMKVVNNETVPQNITFGAYAPYIAPEDIDADAPGITGISGNDEAPFITFKRFTNPKDSINLFWTCETFSTLNPVTVTMRQALARLAVSIKLKNAPASGTKVLIRRVTLSGAIAESAKLKLNVTGEIPKWDEHVMPETPTMIYTDNDPEAEGSADSWGIVDKDIRYVKDLPYSWQPAGLNNSDYKNVISLDEHKAFIYLIPQPSLTLNCTVAYTIVKSDGTVSEDQKSDGPYTIGTTINDVNSFYGNRSYYLQIILTL